MTPEQRAVALVLRFLGVLDALALIVVFVPRAWIAAGHAWLGLGTFPEEPIAGYLARSASALYALDGAAVFFLSFDVRHYWRFIRFLAVVAMIRGGIMVCIDLIEGMPLWWTVMEGVGFTATGVVVFTLQQLAGDPEAARAEAEGRNDGGANHGG